MVYFLLRNDAYGTPDKLRQFFGDWVAPQNETPSTVTSLSLINADTDQPIGGYDPLPSGATLDLAKLPPAISTSAPTRARPPSAAPASLSTATATTRPRVSRPMRWPATAPATTRRGRRRSAATASPPRPKRVRRHGKPARRSPSPSPSRIGRKQRQPSGELALADQCRHQPADPGYDPLPSGATLDLAKLPTRNLNIRANTNPATVGSVRFALDGNSSYRTETAPPYALAGDTSGDYSPWTPSVGSHSVTATPYSGAGGAGTAGTALTIAFTVACDPPAAPAARQR